MNRMESIKERLEKVKRNPYDSFANDGMDSMVKWVQEFRDCAPDDISYLLQRLEIAQKALEGVVNVIHVQGVNRDIGEQSQWDTALLYKVNEALNQLKE